MISMKLFRTGLILVVGLIVVVSATWAGSRPPSNALLLFRDGGVLTGDVFTVDDNSVAMLTDYGITSYDRDEVSQLVFLEQGTALVLKAEATWTDDSNIQGELYYVGGLWDGRSAGTFSVDLTYLEENRLMINTSYDIVRNTMPRGTMSSLAVTDGIYAETGYGDYVQDHAAGVILGGTDDFADCYGSFDLVAHLDLEGEEFHMVAYHIFRFDDVH